MREAKFELTKFLPYLLNQAAEAAGAEFARHYKERYGLLRNDWRVLSHLGSYGPMTARDIARRSRLHKTKISRAVARLEERRLLRRERDAADRRVEHLKLTPAGEAAFEDLRRIALDYDRGMDHALGPERAALLREMLAELARL